MYINIYIYIYICIYIYVYTYILQNSRSPTFWISPKLHELCKSCRRNSLETSE